MSSADEVRREREAQRDFQREQSMVQQAFNSQGELSRGWMREMIGTDDLEDQLQPHTITKIQATLNKQWIVSNLTDAETHDRTYWLEVMKYKIQGDHPPEATVVRGPLRAYLFNDPQAELQPLTAQERNAVEQVIEGLKNMVTRSRGGFEREQINTNIARTETESSSDDGENGWGLFG